MVIDLIKSTGLSAASAALGAVILPNLAASLVGGYGMIAAAGAVSSCFSFAIVLGLIPPIFLISSLVPQEKLSNFLEEHPLLSLSSLALLAAGTVVSGVLLASLVMGQAFLPLLGCMALGGLIVLAGSFLLGQFVGQEPKQNNFAPNF